MGRFRSRLLLTTALALLAVLLAAQSALAGEPLLPTAKAQVRVEASAYPIASPTSLIFDWTKTFYDTAGNPYHPGHASVLGALAAAARAKGFSWEATSGGNFVTEIGGFSSLADGSYGWIFAVNGAGWPVFEDSALAFNLKAGDSVLFTQMPHWTLAGKALVVRFGQADRAWGSGEPVVVTVYADDLQKANSAADRDRFQVNDTFVETPTQFQPVAGATLHIGSRTAVTDATGRVELTDLAPGTYRVWAEKGTDATSFYVRSLQRSINIADPLALTALTARPDPFTSRDTVRFGFTLSRSATVKYTVRSRSGALIASLTRRLAGGSDTLRWSGDNAAGRPVRPGTYRVRLTATDTWGRSATPLTTTIVAR